MPEESQELIDWPTFDVAREQLGAHFARILRYFEEDGVKSVEKIERAMRDGDTAALVVPAHTLKGEAMQFGAGPLSDLAERIEMAARHLIEIQATPDELVPDAAKLRPMFRDTVAVLEQATNPLVARRPAFGQKTAANQTFGRI